METTNPIKSFSGGGGDKILLPVGVYPATFADLRTKEVDDKFHPGERKTVLLFRFDIATDQGTAATFKRTGVAMGPKSSLIPFAKQLAGASWTDDCETDREALWALLQSLVGGAYQVSVMPSNGYNNLQAVIPMTMEE